MVLPGVGVAVDQAGEDDLAARIDLFGIPRAQVRADGGDPVAFDVNVGPDPLARGSIHRDDKPAAYQQFTIHGVHLPLLVTDVTYLLW